MSLGYTLAMQSYLQSPDIRRPCAPERFPKGSWARWKGPGAELVIGTVDSVIPGHGIVIVTGKWANLYPEEECTPLEGQAPASGPAEAREGSQATG
jgi:hypothetical protein